MNMQWLRNIVGLEFWYHAVIAFAIFAVFGLCSRAVRAVLRWVSKKVLPKTETDLDDRIVGVFLDRVRPLMLIIGGYLGLLELQKGTPKTDEMVLQIFMYCEATLYVVAVIIAIGVLASIVRVVSEWYFEKSDTSGVLKETLGPTTGKLANIAVGFIGVIIILEHFDVNIGSLLVSLGVGSLAVALAAQDTLANMIAGFVILIDRPFRVGDRVELPSGQVADVMSIGLRSTRMVNFDSNVIILPNAELVKGRIVNYSSPFNQTRVLLRMNVAYGTDMDLVRRTLLDVARQHKDILPDPAPIVDLTALHDSSVECTLIARVPDFSLAVPITNALREQAYRKFLAEGIEIPFPQRVIHMNPRKTQ